MRADDEQLAPATAEVLADLWERTRALDDLTSDTLLVCLAQWAAAAGGKPDHAVWITADAVLDARGIKRSTKPGEPSKWQHGHRSQDRRAAGRALAQLDSIWLRMVNIQLAVGRRGKKPDAVTVESRALAMLDVVRQDALAMDCESSVFLAARVMPGKWATAFWDTGLWQACQLAKKALDYDPYREQWEKRLAKYLAFHFRYNAKRPGQLHRRVSTLFDAICINPHQDRPHRRRKRFEQAMARLQTDRVVVNWGYLHDQETSNLRAQGWLEQWLQWKVFIEPPAYAYKSTPRGWTAARVHPPEES